jgi:hypothetical protein
LQSLANPKQNKFIIFMTKENSIKIFENKKVRSVWDSEQEKWYISIVDVEVLTESANPRRYWSDLKIKLSK